MFNECRARAIPPSGTFRCVPVDVFSAAVTHVIAHAGRALAAVCGWVCCSNTYATPASVDRFKARMLKVSSLRRAGGDEEYDVYVYPR